MFYSWIYGFFGVIFIGSFEFYFVKLSNVKKWLSLNQMTYNIDHFYQSDGMEG